MGRSRGPWCVVAAVLLAGCGGVVSRPVRLDAVPFPSFQALRDAPEAYAGKTVIVGGDVIETRNGPEGTTVVVLEKPLGHRERPTASDVTGGRFMVRFSDYLDPVLFATGRAVTVAGRVRGVEVEKVGDTPYRYLLLDGIEIHLWRQPAPAAYPAGYPYDPWYPWYPWWYDPYWGRRPWW